jgi:hypothetical protein
MCMCVRVCVCGVWCAGAGSAAAAGRPPAPPAPASCGCGCGLRHPVRGTAVTAGRPWWVPCASGRWAAAAEQQQQQELRGTWQWQPSSGGVLKCHPAPLRALSWPFVKDQARSRSGCEAGGEVHFFLGFYLRRRRLAQQTRRWWSSFFRMTGIKRSRLARI